MITTPLDRRRHAYRPDLADSRLEGQVASERFVEGTRQQIRAHATPLRASPDATRAYETEALHGETVRVFDDAGGWAWVQLEHDGYVGYIHSAALTADIIAPTHRVHAPATFVYPSASIKTTPIGQLSLNAHVTVTEEDDRFATLATGGVVIARHLRNISTHARDFVDVAETLIHTPYLWGGRTRAGLDCSALVQLSLNAAGIACPRDTDMQAAEVGTNVPIPADLDDLQRGDLVFWPGHVGILIDGIMLLHANGHHMATVIEPLSQAVRRIANANAGTTASGPQISAIKRLARAGNSGQAPSSESAS
jgi:cell wall-associated NlpC family hydrolase